MEKLKCNDCYYGQDESQCEEQFTNAARGCNSFLRRINEEMSMGDISDEEAWSHQVWLENAPEDDESHEWSNSDLVHCELCNKLFSFDGFGDKWCEDCR